LDSEENRKKNQNSYIFRIEEESFNSYQVGNEREALILCDNHCTDKVCWRFDRISKASLCRNHRLSGQKLILFCK
jgi:hypothetical protein